MPLYTRLTGGSGSGSGTGTPGPRGYSAYQIATQNGFVGTVADWLASLVGPPGPGGVFAGVVPGAPASDGTTVGEWVVTASGTVWSWDGTAWQPLGTLFPGIEADVQALIDVTAPLSAAPPMSEDGVTATSWFLERKQNGTVAWRPQFVLHQNFYGVYPAGFDPNGQVTGTLGDWVVTEDGVFWVYRTVAGTPRWVDMGQLDLPAGGGSFAGVFLNQAALPAAPAADAWAVTSDGQAWQFSGGVWVVREQLPARTVLSVEWPQLGDIPSGPDAMWNDLDGLEGVYEARQGDYAADVTVRRVGNVITAHSQSAGGGMAVTLGPAGTGCELVLSDGRGRFHRYTAPSSTATSWTDAGQWDTKAAGISSPTVAPLLQVVPTAGGSPADAWNSFLDAGINTAGRFVVAPTTGGPAEVVLNVTSAPAVRATITQGSTRHQVIVAGVSGPSSWLTIQADGTGVLRTSPDPATAWTSVAFDLTSGGATPPDLSALEARVAALEAWETRINSLESSPWA